MHPRPHSLGAVAVQPRPRCVSADLVPRTIYFPPAVLARLERKPGDLIELLTVMISDHLKGGAQ